MDLIQCTVLLDSDLKSISLCESSDLNPSSISTVARPAITLSGINHCTVCKATPTLVQLFCCQQTKKYSKCNLLSARKMKDTTGAICHQQERYKTRNLSSARKMKVTTSAICYQQERYQKCNLSFARKMKDTPTDICYQQKRYNEGYLSSGRMIRQVLSVVIQKDITCVIFHLSVTLIYFASYSYMVIFIIGN